MEKTEKKSKTLPVVAGWLLFIAALCCIWLLWQEYREQKALADAANERIMQLANEKIWLQGLLKAEPCQARAALQAPPPGFMQ